MFYWLFCQGKVIKVLNLWQKSGIYSPDVIQPLLNLPSTLSQGGVVCFTLKFKVVAFDTELILWILWHS